MRTAEDAENAEERGETSGDKRVNENEIGEQIIRSAIRVHSTLGPGLLESAYEACLVYEIGKRGVPVSRQVALPVNYDEIEIDAGYRLDLLVDKKVVVEIKAVDALAPIHTAQVLTYLKLSGFKLGYILNFNVAQMKHGIKRVVNGL